jgi:hypothetical protein
MAAMLAAALTGSTWLMIVTFIFVYMLQNIWRPVLISRIDAHSTKDNGATILSVESQAKSLGAAILAPFIGILVDAARSATRSAARSADGGIEAGVTVFWPIAALGAGLSLIFLVTGFRNASKKKGEKT